MPDPTPLAGRLKSLRAAATPPLSQTDLARASGVSLDAIQDLEQGRRLAPTVATLRALAGALGVSVDELFPEPKETR
jgi:transcriptional regulator with XRE-family HTH domain